MDAILQLPNFEAILLITHDIDLAVCYANRVVLVYQGRIVADGPPQEVLAQYFICEIGKDLGFSDELLDRKGLPPPGE